MTAYAETTEQLTRNEEKVIVVDSLCTSFKLIGYSSGIVFRTVGTTKNFCFLQVFCTDIVNKNILV